MEIICPYCGQRFQEPHDYQVADESYEAECPNCEKVCAYEIELEIVAHAYKAPCLNGGEHNWFVSTTYPEFMSQRVCTCGKKEYIYSGKQRQAKLNKYYKEIL